MSFTTQRKSPRRLISLREAADRLGLDESTVRKRKCRTENLSHVRIGTRLLLVESEVEGLLDQLIAEAEAANPIKRAAKKFRLAG